MLLYIILLISSFFLLYAAPAAVLSLPIIWWSRAIQWRWWEIALLTAPFVAWFSATLIVGQFFEKSLSNAFVEAFLAGCAAWIPTALGAVAAHRGWPRQVAYFTGLTIACLIALSIFTLVPPLPE